MPIPENPTEADASVMLADVCGPLDELRAELDPAKQEILVTIEPSPLPGTFAGSCDLYEGRMILTLKCLRSGVKLGGRTPFNKDSLIVRNFRNPAIDRTYRVVFDF